MNVVVLGPTYPFRGGIAHHTTLLYRALAARHTTRLVSFTRQYPRGLFPGASDRDTSAVPLRVEGVEYRLDPLGPRTWFAAAQSIAETRPDLLVIPWWLAYWAPSLGTVARRVRALAPRTRVVFVCHNVVPHERAALSGLLTRWALAPGHAYVLHAEAQAAALRALLPGAGTRVTPHPRYDMFAGAAPSQAEARAALGMPFGAPVALFFGFVRAYKGLDDLLAALPAARAQVPGLRLLVAGEFWGGAQGYAARARALGVAEALTLVDRYIPNEDVARYFAAADVAVLPYREATGSGIAAMAYGFGLPVIATTAGGLASIVRDELSGLLVAPGDPPALAAALVRFFAGDLRERLRAGAAAQREALSWERLVDVLEELAR